MAPLQDTENFNIGPDLGISKFTTNGVRNEVSWGMFKRIVEETKINPVLRPRLPSPEELACQAS